MDAGALERLCADFETEVDLDFGELLERHAAELGQWIAGVGQQLRMRRRAEARRPRRL